MLRLSRSPLITLLITIMLACFLALPGARQVRAETLTLLALGDSLTAGYGIDQPQSYPARLEAALRARGWDVSVINGGVSGDTMAQGAARLDWSLSPEVDAVIVELGANDALRGLPPEQAEASLESILATLKTRRLPTLVMGMKAPPNMGPDYARAFADIYVRQSAKYGAMLYPFFLEGVAADASLNQPDGIHPNVAGVAVIVERTVPVVESLLGEVKPAP